MSCGAAVKVIVNGVIAGKFPANPSSERNLNDAPPKIAAMIPIPTSRVFRSRRGALIWCGWVIVGAVMFVGFGDAPAKPDVTHHATDALGMSVDEQNLKVLVAAMNAS